MKIEKLDGFTADGLGNVIGASSDLSDGDVERITDGPEGALRITEKIFHPQPSPPSPLPRLLSKTAFQDYAVSQLGGGVTGMGRFTEIMDATAGSANAAVRFAFARYEAALTFEKTNVDSLTAIMAADTTSGHLTADERTAILANWPNN